MTTYTTTRTSVQMFPDGYTTIIFSRPVTCLFLTTSAGAAKKISFDGGAIYMDLIGGTFHSFYHLHQLRIDLLGSGTVTGMGYAC